MRRLEAALTALTAATCGWEAIAIVLRRFGVPTVTRLCKKHPWLRPVIILGLAAHLYWQQEHVSVAETA